MKARPQIALAVAAGYMLGRTHKMRWALMLVTAGAAGRLGTSPSDLVRHGANVLGSSPAEAADEDEAARLREEIRDTTEDATRDVRMRLGEIIQQGIAAKRDADTGRLMQALSPHSVATAVREPTHEQDAVHVAFLVETARRSDFEEALDGLARGWEERIDLRLRGPLAPYDFVVKPN